MPTDRTIEFVTACSPSSFAENFKNDNHCVFTDGSDSGNKEDSSWQSQRGEGKVFNFEPLNLR